MLWDELWMRRREKPSKHRQSWFLKTELRKLSFRFWVLWSVQFSSVFRKVILDIFIGLCTPVMNDYVSALNAWMPRCVVTRNSLMTLLTQTTSFRLRWLWPSCVWVYILLCQVYLSVCVLDVRRSLCSYKEQSDDATDTDDLIEIEMTEADHEREAAETVEKVLRHRVGRQGG